MPAKEPGYDAIGSTYEDYARQATLKSAERHSVLEMAGGLRGLRVLDLACGTGFYTRLLKEGGAESVVGVDLSPEMIRVAESIDHERPLGVTYRVGNAEELSGLGAFDLVTAVWLLNYADTRADLLHMARGAYANLAPGGRFVTFTINPEYDFRKYDFAKYGVRVRGEVFEHGRFAMEGEFVIDPDNPVTVMRWSREIYDEVLREAGFRDVSWRPAEPSAEDIRALGEDYWRDFRENCIGIGLVCSK